ncbi:MAG: thiol-disulfide oxidoreductase DCC family protein [Pyrinomonadaceae bacterium]
MNSHPQALVLFDGVCNFCNGSVNFIIARDPKAYFSFAPLQSETAIEILGNLEFDSKQTDSIVLIENGKVFVYSTAALRIAKKLSGGWKLFYAFVVLPKPVRDYFYRAFAKNRYKFFGKKEQCMIPTPEARARFLA